MSFSKGEKNPKFKTGLKMKNNEHSPIYNSWCNMKQRCFNEKHPKFKRYGGRGISICKEWLNISAFYEWSLKNGWEKGLSIDRIDNNGNYCPENCKWVSFSENSRKKSTKKIDIITAQEIRSRIKENWYALAKEYKCTHGNIWFIMKNFTHVDEGECSKALKERDKNKWTKKQQKKF